MHTQRTPVPRPPAGRCALRILLAMLFVPAFVPAAIDAQAGPANRAVLVTGASTGIGRAIAERLAAEGFFVYAGARKAEDIAELSAIANMQGIRLDVTVDADLAAAVRTIERAGRGLHGVVNNAGVAAAAPLIEMDESDMRFLFDVNVFGPYRVTRAFAPLLIRSRGRVVNISSISGILSGQLLGAYSMSKHALEAYADALGAEMAQFGVQVSLVEPGNHRSAIGRTTSAQIEQDIAARPDSPWLPQMRNMVAAMARYDSYPAPDGVAEATLRALSDSSPQQRYMVVAVEREGEITIRKAIDELVQLNQGHQFSYDRDALIRMLDESLARHPSPRP